MLNAQMGTDYGKKFYEEFVMVKLDGSCWQHTTMLIMFSHWYFGEMWLGTHLCA